MLRNSTGILMGSADWFYMSDIRISGLREGIRFIEDVCRPDARSVANGQILNPVITEVSDCGYFCSCSRERVSRALMTVGEKELRSMIDEGKPVELNCHFCGKSYTFSVKDLERMCRTPGAS